MKLDFNRSTDTSRFTLALLLSTTTALLVAAPFIAMFSSAEADEVNPASPSNSNEPVPPALSLGIDEAEVGRIGETKPIPPRRTRPQTPAHTVSSPAPDTTVETPVSDPTTTVPEQTTMGAPEISVAPESTIAPKGPSY